MNNSEIKGAVNAAWSAAGTKLFKLDINDDPKHDGIDIYPKTLDGELLGVSWRILPDVGIVARYADNLKDGTSEVIEEMNFKDADEIEKIFTDEFASLDETLQISLENGAAAKPEATRERRTPTIKLAALISKLQELRKDAGNVDVFINVPISATQSEERSIANVYNEGGYVAIYAEEA